MCCASADLRSSIEIGGKTAATANKRSFTAGPRSMQRSVYCPLWCPGTPGVLRQGEDGE